MRQKIAYIMSRFPHLPETFILREMTELETHGWQVELYPLIFQDQTVIHSEAKAWIPRVNFLPFISPKVMAANCVALLRQPRSYLGGLFRALWENRTSLNFFMRAAALFPKAVYAAQLMKQAGVTHIHTHYATHPALVAWLVHHLTGISYSVTVHAHDIFVCTAMLATKLRDASFVVAISNYNREYLAQVVGPWVLDKTHVIHCGIVPDNYSLSSNSHRSTDRFEIINIGSLQTYKGQPYLLQACELLRDRGIPLHCRIIGGGEERNKLEQMIAEMNLNSVVDLLGPLPQEEVARLLPTADCYVQPSIITPSGKMEGIPVSLMEAMATGLPVIATSISGVPELVRPGETGYLVPPADAGALAEALDRVYTNSTEAARMAEAGQSLVLREFELGMNVRSLSSLLKQVVPVMPIPPGKKPAMVKIEEME